MRPFRRILLLILLALFLLLFLVTPGVSWAGTLEDAARQFAGQIAAKLSAGTAATLMVRNLSSLSNTDSDRVRKAIESELEARGIRLPPQGNNETVVRVTLSENFEGYVWAAEYGIDDASGVILVQVPRPPVVQSIGPHLALVLEKDLLWSQPAPILDLKFSGDSGEGGGREMYILSKGSLAEYRSSAAGWEKLRECAITDIHPWPRDPRGYLLLQEHSLVVLLSGMRCTLSLRAEQTALSPACSETGIILWPLFQGVEKLDRSAEFTRARNYFSGQLIGGTGTQTMVLPFYSAAFLPASHGGPRVSLFAGLLGETVLSTEVAKPRSDSLENWGSNLASVHTSCGSGWQVLATGAGDWTEADMVRAYEISEGEAIAASPPLGLPGPVTVLGPLAEGVALGVVHNLRTGRYEAYRITASCNH